MDLNLDEFDLVEIDNVATVSLPNEETLYDITVEGDHTFFAALPESNDLLLMHNCDGSHITAMLIGWFKKFAPNLFNEGRICKLTTPNIIIEDAKGKLINYFMSVQDFKKWEAANPNHKSKIVYLKGLGSWDRQQLIDLISANGLDKFIVEYHLDDEGNVFIEDWLGSSAEKRKEYLREFTFDIDQA